MQEAREILAARERFDNPISFCIVITTVVDTGISNETVPTAQIGRVCGGCSASRSCWTRPKPRRLPGISFALFSDVRRHASKRALKLEAPRGTDWTIEKRGAGGVEDFAATAIGSRAPCFTDGGAGIFCAAALGEVEASGCFGDTSVALTKGRERLLRLNCGRVVLLELFFLTGPRRHSEGVSQGVGNKNAIVWLLCCWLAAPCHELRTVDLWLCD
jgi:hypothetical protein